MASDVGDGVIGMAPDDRSELLDVPEAAAVLHLKESTIRKWIYLRKLPHLKLGSRVFVRRQDIESKITESLVPARKQPSVSSPMTGSPLEATVGEVIVATG